MPSVVGVGLWMSVVYSSIVGANSVPWKSNTARSRSQNSVAVLKKIQSTGVLVSMTTSPMMSWMNACMTVPVYAWFSVLLGEPLTRDGGSRLKGVNSLKSSKDLWGPVRWHSRLDPFPYSEPLTNLASYIGARGMSDKVPKKLV
ncbi:hypothetical protein CRG98_044944 [Punica granatum]|uniref:Secreted protein n=1 Tax=Punica granatum TaxID=22663 RepID=A0A2I0HSH5_PUNGR|nr:hypothetical protein CRG98_044944 [Punica granatum]